MQPLVAARRMMMWLSMCLADESSNERQKRAYVAHTLAVLFFNLIGFIASLVFCSKHVSIDFDGAAYAFSTAVGEFGVVCFLVAAILMRHQIDNIIESLSTIYRSNEGDTAFRHLARVNTTSDWMCTIYMKYSACVAGGMATTSLLSVLYCYLFHGHLNADHFYRPMKIVLPWNQSTAMGYFGEMGVSISLGYAYMVLNGTALLLFISLCMHHQAFYGMFKERIKKSEKCDTELLCSLIRFHISAKNLFLDSASVYSSFVLVQLICSTVLMTLCVFYMDLQWHHFDFTMVSITMATSFGMSCLFLYCYLGKLATESHEMMSDCIYNMKWYEHPTELQKYFILMIQNMQKPIYYHGFYVTNLDLRTFIKLCNSVYSYYMVMKTLAAK